MHSAEDWDELLLPEIERQQAEGKQVAFRADTAFAKTGIYEALEERGVKYAIRIPANDSLERDIVELLTRRVGRPSHKPVVWCKGFLYQAAGENGRTPDQARPILLVTLPVVAHAAPSRRRYLINYTAKWG